MCLPVVIECVVVAHPQICGTSICGGRYVVLCLYNTYIIFIYMYIYVYIYICVYMFVCVDIYINLGTHV